MKYTKKIILFLCIVLFFISITGVSAHDSDYPSVLIESPSHDTVVSGDVEIITNVNDHHELQYVNFTIEGVDNTSYIDRYQDNNPTDGWSYIWDTSQVSNGRYYIQSRAINSMNLKGEYNILIHLNNTKQKSVLTVDNATIGVNQTNYINAHLMDKNNYPLSNKEIVANIGTTPYTITTNDEGLATFVYSNSQVGTYEIYAKFLGDNLYSPVTASGIVNVIPPSIIQTYGSYIGGNGNDKGKGVCIDDDGYIYLAMETNSKDLIATPNAYQNSSAGGKDIYITKFTPEGNIVFSTFLGGSATEMQKDLKVDKDGNIYVIGFTQSSNLPVTDNAFQKNLSGVQDGFLLVLNSEGTDLIYGTYIGGSKIDRAWAICVDDNGNAYIQGITNSIDFCVTSNAYQSDKDGVDWDGNVNASDIDYQNSFDLFLIQVDTKTGNLVYGTYFGGRGSDSTYGSLAIDKKGVMYFGGTTTSIDFPTTPNANRTVRNIDEADSFIAALDIKNNKLLYSSYIGGNATDDGEALFIDNNGYLYYVGDTWSSNFPTTANAYQKNFAGVGEGV